MTNSVCYSLHRGEGTPVPYVNLPASSSACAAARTEPEECSRQVNRREAASVNEGTLLDAKPLHPITHGPERDAEELRSGGAVVARLFERLVDRGALDAVEVVLQGPFVAGGQRGVGLLGRRREVQVVGGDPLRIACERQTALQDVLELAHIARKRIRLQGRDRGIVEFGRRGARELAQNGIGD